MIWPDLALFAAAAVGAIRLLPLPSFCSVFHVLCASWPP
jgi:hypothetical protein